MPRKLLNGSSVTLVFTFGLNSNENEISRGSGRRNSQHAAAKMDPPEADKHNAGEPSAASLG
jgi:hypothetical protein